MTHPSTSEVVCAACSTRGTGRFCSSCGASLESAVCAGCNASLSPGARFCHNCGLATAALPESLNTSSPAIASAPRPAPSAASSLPWIVAAIALVTLLAFLAGNAFNSRRGSTLDAPQNALPQEGLDGRPPAADGGPADGGSTGAIRGPDISQLSPQERADRLFNRVMLLSSEGKSDSVLFFAPMAISAYQMLAPMNADQRYDLGRIAEVAGALPLARAQADTILAQNPTHLLGLTLASRIASLEKRTSDQNAYDSKLVAASQSELAKKLPEYQRHQADITSALADATRRGSR
jgi:ribosomal protein L40E